MTTERLISPASRDSEDEQLSLSLRPRSLNEFIGQRDLLERISIAVRAARQRGESMEHVLLHGPPGLGKTTLAHVIAAEMGAHVHVTSGPALTRGSDLVGALTRLAEEMGAVADGSDTDYTRFAEGDAWLHHLVATASANRFIAEAVAGLNVHLHIFRFLFETNATEGAMKEHGVLIEALLARDPAAAEQAMRVHLQASRDRMNVVMDEREKFADMAAAPTDAGPKPRRMRGGNLAKHEAGSAD